MSSAYSFQGAVLIANIWWYGFSVLRPAQALKPFGLYRSREIGDRPERAPGRGAGQYYCKRYKKPVLLPGRTDNYDTVVDFDVSFGNLVALIFKATLAAIPAMLALVVLGVWLAIAIRSFFN